MSRAELEQRAATAAERRHWVRTTYACNNRCAFCLDGDQASKKHRPLDELRSELEAGRRDGATRLILSGGEPTIHPEFLSLIALGRELGYERVQAISNGRMFAYRRFAREAVDAGLDEVTVSLHGHTDELGDEMVGVRRGFEQTVAGIRNLAGDDRVHVSVDVVVNRRNVLHLREILELAYGLGVREFDVLQITPFGRGNSPDMLYAPDDPPGALRAVQRGLDVADWPDVFLWTNRFPAPWLEGREHLIQDPKKLLDEVRGRRAWFEAWIARGEPPPCRDARCTRCFVSGFCDTVERALGELPEVGEPVGVELTREAVERAVEQGGWPGVAPPRLPLRDTVDEVLEHDLDLDLVRLLLPALPPVREAPVCLGGVPEDSPPRPARSEVTRADGTLDLDRLVQWHIRAGYRVKSFRCAGCAHDAECRGLPVQRARVWGLGRVRPVVARPAPAPGTSAPGCEVGHGGSGSLALRARGHPVGSSRAHAPDDEPSLCEFTVEDGVASLVVRNPCRNACSFCTTAAVHRERGLEWETDPPQQVIRTLEELERRGVERVRFVAFELLDHPSWPTILLAARELGLGPLEIWTHGRGLAEPLAAKALAAAGVDRVRVPLFGASAEVHDRVAGVQGAFEETSAGLLALQADGAVELVLTSVLVPDNLGALLALLRLDRRGVPGRLKSIALAEPSSADEEQYRPLALDWRELEGVLRDAPDAELRLEAVMRLLKQVPTCVLQRAAPDETAEALAAPRQPGAPLLEVGQARGAAFKQRVRCPLADGCRLGDRCPGLFGAHLELFGTAGIEAVP